MQFGLVPPLRPTQLGRACEFANRAKVAAFSTYRVRPLVGSDFAGIMDMATKVTATGASGAQYTFSVNGIPAAFRSVPAVYMLACRAVGGWKVLYVGECADLKSHLRNNQIWEEAVRWFGATHVLVYSASKNDAARKRIERDLIQAKEPVMNVSGQASISYAK